MQRRSPFPQPIARPQVPPTPAGVDELAAWQERQVKHIAVVWAVPVATFFFTLLFARLSFGAAEGISMLCAVISGVLAPGLTLVFLLRGKHARCVAARLPQMPRAVIEPKKTGSRRAPRAPRLCLYSAGDSPPGDRGRRRAR